MFNQTLYSKERINNRIMINNNIKMLKNLGHKQTRKQLIVLLTIISLIKLFNGEFFSLVVCQDFEDLNHNQQQQQHLNKPLQHTFQPLNRQSQPSLQQQQQQQNVAAATINTFQPSAIAATTTTSRQRPLLSNRFALNNNNNLAAQASTNSAVFSSPQQAAQQPAPVVATPTTNGISNIEQLMKNALARTAKMNSEAADPRQDIVSSIGSEEKLIAPPVTAGQLAPAAAQAGLRSMGNQQQQARSANLVDKQAEASENLPSASETRAPRSDSSNSSSGDSSTLINSELENDNDKLTTVAQTTTTNGHETVYSEQRFANLFARRNNLKKSKIQPTEQVKAKPTLPSFIKSPPDPKQFSANQQQESQSININNVGNNNNNNNIRSSAAQSSSSFASQRVTNQGRINLANQQKISNSKPILTSNSASNANQKRTNSLALSSTPKPKATSSQLNSASSNLKPINGNKPSSAPSVNNPFNRSQINNNNNDPANVIAMARKRLLANNALESAKLKQQQQQQQQQNKAT